MAEAERVALPAPVGTMTAELARLATLEAAPAADEALLEAEATTEEAAAAADDARDEAEARTEETTAFAEEARDAAAELAAPAADETSDATTEGTLE